LGCVIHAAGVLDDGLLPNQTPERLSAVLAPKVLGSWYLHELTAHMHLEAFVLFSSISALDGTPGQSGYAAANAFLDGLAHHRKRMGLEAISINWSGWADSGMAARAAVAPESTMDPEEALGVLDMLLASGEPQAAVVTKHTPECATTSETSQPDIEWNPLSDPGTSMQERKDAVRNYIRKVVARVVESESEVVDLGDSWMDLGLDSLMAVELRNYVERDFEVTISLSDLQRAISPEHTISYIVAHTHRGDGADKDG